MYFMDIIFHTEIIMCTVAWKQNKVKDHLNWTSYAFLEVFTGSVLVIVFL